MIPIQDTALGARFAVRVHPRGRKNAITGEVGDSLKVTLTAPPVEGRANLACIEFFADFLQVSRSSVLIVSGQTGRSKVVQVSGLSADQIRERLAQSTR